MRQYNSYYFIGINYKMEDPDFECKCGRNNYNEKLDDCTVPYCKVDVKNQIRRIANDYHLKIVELTEGINKERKLQEFYIDAIDNAIYNTDRFVVEKKYFIKTCGKQKYDFE